MSIIGRNSPCPCGSGKKFKKCCYGKQIESPSQRLSSAVSLHQAGNLEQAKVIYQSLLEENPNSNDTMHYLHYLGMIEHNDGKYNEAVQLIKKAINRNKKIAAFHCNLGNAYTQLGLIQEAIQSYNIALELEPNFHQANFNLHALMIGENTVDHLENNTQALNCMKKACEILPANAIYRFYFAMLNDYSGKHNIATKHFEMIDPTNALNRSMIDAWEYIRNVNQSIPKLCGYSMQTFQLCMERATNEGLVLEFGVRHGNSIRQLAKLSAQDVHGFDSFEGIPEDWHQETKGSYSTKGQIPEVPENVTLHVGWFENSLPDFLIEHKEPVRFVNIDCDIYRSTKTVLDLLHDRFVEGTVIVFDEYIGYEHWRKHEFKAFQEASITYGWSYEYLCFSFMTKQVGVRIL